VWSDVAFNPPDLLGIQSTVALRAIWPTSKDSRAASIVTQVGPVVTGIRSFGTPAGDLEVTLSAYSLYHVVRYTSGGTQSSYACASTDYAPSTCLQNTGAMNTELSLTALFAGKLTPKVMHDALSVSATYLMLDAWAYQTPDATLVDLTGGTTLVARAKD